MPNKPPGWGGFIDELIKLIRFGDKLTDEAVDLMLRDLGALHGSLYNHIGNAGIGMYTNVDIQNMKQAADDIIFHSAVEMKDIIAAAEMEAYAAGYAGTWSTIEFGEAVTAGVGEAGHAYYAPEVLAPTPGFAIRPPLREVSERAVLRAYTFEKIVGVTEEMRQKIGGAITQAYVSGGSGYDVMQYITNVLGIRPYDPYWAEIGLTGISSKAENIFRTELMTAQNLAAHDAIEDVKKVHTDLHHMWMATGDLRTRDSHLDAHGQVVPVDKPFHVGGFEAMFPLDPILPPQERCRCRCRDIPYKPSWGTAEELFGDLQREINVEKERRMLEKAKVAKTKAKAKRKAAKTKPKPKAKASETSILQGQSTKNMAPDEIIANEIKSKRYIGDEFVRDISDEKLLNTKQNFFPEKKAGEYKDRICSYLEQETGLDYTDVNMFIRQWAGTSNGSDMRSLGIQETAANVFRDCQLSTWQKEQIAEIAAKPAGTNLGGLIDEAQQRLFEKAPGVVFNSIAEAGYTTAEVAEEALLRAMYEWTQNELKEAGIENLVVRRGMGIEKSIANLFDELEEILYKGNSLSSWSADTRTAIEFAEQQAYGKDGVVYEMVIPRERIISCCRTGHGCLDEWEFVISGGSIQDQVLIKSKLIY